MDSDTPVEGGSVEGAVVVWSPGDFLFFEDARLAESYMEPVDVENGEYRAFARDGRELCIEVLTSQSTHLFGLMTSRSEAVALREGCHGAFPLEELRYFMGLVGAPIEAGASFEELMSVGFARYLYR